MRRTAAAVLAAVAVTACTAGSQDLPPPRDGRSGLHGAGTLDGRQIAVGTGLPQLLVGDCDPVDAPDQDVCFIADTIDGRSFVLTIENPGLLAVGEPLEVADSSCTSPEACDAVRDALIVSLKLEADDPIRATGGTTTMTRVEPFTNYVGEVSLRLPDGRFSGTFDVIPRPE